MLASNLIGHRHTGVNCIGECGEYNPFRVWPRNFAHRHNDDHNRNYIMDGRTVLHSAHYRYYNSRDHIERHGESVKCLPAKWSINECQFHISARARQSQTTLIERRYAKRLCLIFIHSDNWHWWSLFLHIYILLCWSARHLEVDSISGSGRAEAEHTISTRHHMRLNAIFMV